MAVWVAAVAVVTGVATAAGYDPFLLTTWKHWDAAHYLEIAVSGFDLERCYPDTTSDMLCGSAGWFPAYPWVFGAIARVGFAPGLSGVVVSSLFALATLLVLWCTFLRALPVRDRLAPLIAAAFVPGQIYHHSLFPMSMLAFFTVVHLWLLSRRRFVAAGIAGAVAAATYPLGALLVGISAFFALCTDRAASAYERMRRAAVSAGLTAIGPLVVLTAMKLQTGSWTAYFQVQERYDHGLHLPVEVLREAVEPLVRGRPVAMANFPPIQTLFVASLVMLVIVCALARRKQLTDSDKLLVAFTIVVWLFPLTQMNLSLYRAEAALLPAMILLRHAPRSAALLVAATCVLLSVPMAVLFFQDELI